MGTLVVFVRTLKEKNATSEMSATTDSSPAHNAMCWTNFLAFLSGEITLALVKASLHPLSSYFVGDAPGRFMEEHHRFYCGGRRVNCHGCGMALSFKNIMQHIQHECENAEFLRAGGLIGAESGLVKTEGLPLSSPNATSVTADTEVALSPSGDFGTTAFCKTKTSTPVKPKHSYLHRVDTGDLDAFHVQESPISSQAAAQLVPAIGSAGNIARQIPGRESAAFDDIPINAGSVSSRSGAPSDNDDDHDVAPSFTVKTSTRAAVEARVRNAPVVSLHFDADNVASVKQQTPSSGLQFGGGIRPGKSVASPGSALYYGAAGGGKTLSNPVALSSGPHTTKSVAASSSAGFSFGSGGQSHANFAAGDTGPLPIPAPSLTRNPSLHELLSLLPPVQEHSPSETGESEAQDSTAHDALDSLVVSPASTVATTLAPLQKRAALGNGGKLPQLESGVGSGRSPQGSDAKAIVRAEGDLVTRTGLRGAGEIVGANRQFHVKVEKPAADHH